MILRHYVNLNVLYVLVEVQTIIGTHGLGDQEWSVA